MIGTKVFMMLLMEVELRDMLKAPGDAYKSFAKSKEKPIEARAILEIKFIF
jgi:hypothetical protein